MGVSGAHCSWPSTLASIFRGCLWPSRSESNAEPVRSYQVGVRTRWFMGDVDQLLMRLRRSRVALSLPPDVGGKTKAVLEFLSAFGPSNRGEVFRVSDPMPGILETFNWIRGR